MELSRTDHITFGISMNGRVPVTTHDTSVATPDQALTSALRYLAHCRLSDPVTRYTLHLTVTDLFGNELHITSDELEDAAYLEQEVTDGVAA